MFFKCPNIVLESPTTGLNASKVRKHCNFVRICYKLQNRYFSKTHMTCSLMLGNVHCAQVVLQIKFNYNFYISKSRAICQ